MSESPLHLSVVIPAFNEARRLPTTLERVLNYLRKQNAPFEVIVGDDGSSDGTANAARLAGREVKVVTIGHSGKGAAVRSGVLASSGDLVLLTDADLSTPIEQLEGLCRALEVGAGLAVGSRHMPSSRIELNQPFHRRLMGRVFNLIVRVLVLRGVRDTQCGFKLFRGSLAREIFSVARVDGFAFDVEAILLARRLGAQVAEVPVEWHHIADSRVRAVRDSARMFLELLAIRRRARTLRRLPTGETVVRGAAPSTVLGRLGRPGELALVFCLALAAYLAAGAYLIFHEHLIAGDAYSRVAIAHRVLFSRDPHLAAIGFVWSPLPILALLPLVLLQPVWSALTSYGFAASIVSALCMAGAVRELVAFLRETGVGRADRLFLTLAFAPHPLILLYAANGMSEAMFLLLLLMATRRLVGWLRTADLALGSGAALSLAGAYLARYEALIAGGMAVVLVAVWAYRQTPGSSRQRLGQVACDTALLAAPIVAAFTGLAVASWIVTGNPMEQFSSIYGNSAQLRAWGVAVPAGGLGIYPTETSSQVLVLEPFMVVVAAFAVLHAWTDGHGGPTLAALALIGGVFAFMFWSSTRGQLDHQLRYMITAIPLAVLAAGSFLAWRNTRQDRQGGLARGGQRRAITALRRSATSAVAVGTVLMVASALPVSAYAMASSGVNPTEAVVARAIYGEDSTAERRAKLRFSTDREIAADLDAMRLPQESVLVDDFLGFAVPLNSRNPRQFVITSDRDFRAVLNDPTGAGIIYVLVPEPKNLGVLDAVNRRYPALYTDGAGIGVLVHEYTNQGDVPPAHWRLYRLVETGT